MTSEASLSIRNPANAFGPFARSVGEVCQRHLVPALFQSWTEPVLDAANVEEDMRVADIACSTGVVARAAACRVGMRGFVAGVDGNEQMLDVARSRTPVVIGGAQVYQQALPRIQRFYLTEIYAEFKGDAYFPELNANEWQEESRE